MKITVRHIATILIVIANLPLIGQFKTRLINKTNVNSFGYTDTIDALPIVINTNGNVVISGNQKISTSQYNATTMSQLSTGITNWINQYNGTGQKSYIMASNIDLNGNIITVGGVRTNTTNGVDMLIIKTNPAGIVLWTTTYNGSNSLNDFAVDVCTDGNGDIYIAGATDNGISSMIDYVTVKIDANGNQQWASLYDHNNTIDFPTAIDISPVTNELIVSGSSGTSFMDWDFATVSYDITNGNQTGVTRNANNAGAAQDKVFSMGSDAFGNIYIAGSTYNGTNFDIQLVKLDTALNTVYTKTFDAHGFDDAGISLAVDAYNNIIVAGYSYSSPLQREMTVLKYNTAGTLLWARSKKSPIGGDADAYRVNIATLDDYFIGGNYGTGNNQNVALLGLDSTGKVTMEKVFDGYGFKDRFMDLALSNNKVMLSVRSLTASNSTLEQNLVVTYEYQTTINNVAQTGSAPLQTKYIDNELIVYFNPTILKQATINNKEILFGKLNDFIPDSTCDKITFMVDPEGLYEFNARNLDTRKIFFDMTMNDTISETRLGTYVKVPPFYSNLLVKFPTNLSISNVKNQVQTILPDVFNCQLNHVAEFTSPPSDPSYTAQASLFATNGYTAAHINVDSAWAISTGAPHVRVGIYDSGIQPGLPDLPTNIPGYDFYNNSSLSNGDLDNHGTPIAGIIGAIRNNNVGIAGIAGGDALNNAQGVTLYDCKTGELFNSTEAILAPAITKGANGANINGFALHIMNLSIKFVSTYTWTPWANGGHKLMIDVMDYANRNGVALAAAKGNQTLVVYSFPADWNEKTTMSIGSSGYNGQWCFYQNNCSSASYRGGLIDFVAPGTTHLIRSTGFAGSYNPFDGTSMAVPNVCGAISLFMSHRNSTAPSWNNIVHEDCENILKLTCTDLDSSTYFQAPGYDTATGWGRINVKRALSQMDVNYYRFRHITETTGNISVTTSTTLVNSGTMYWENFPQLPTGNYFTEIYEKTSTINYSLFPSEVIKGYWPLAMETYGNRYETNYIDYERPNYCQIVSVSPTSAVLKTWYYHIPNQNVWMPYAPNNIKSAITLYTYDSTGQVVGNQHINKTIENLYKIRPNPNNGQFNILFNSGSHKKINYQITNLLGQLVTKSEFWAEYGENEIEIMISQLKNGVYILTIFDNNVTVHQEKIIKQ